MPINKMFQIAEELAIDIIEEERKYERIIHQKLSKIMAQHIFLVDDTDILSAIECHTTLKSDSTLIDKILFISDKITFEGHGEQNNSLEIYNKVNQGYLNEAIIIYLDNIWEQRNKLKLIHPWLIDAREQLLRQV